MEITVVIPTYNRYALLKRALASVVAQTLQPKEVIVVDDGSDDATQKIQKDFPNIYYIYQKNRGVSAARNLGITHATSEWVAFLDSDDVWHEAKLREQVNFHKKNPALLMSYTDEVWIRNNEVVTIPKKFQKIGKDAFLENLSYCNIAPSSVLMHVTLFERFGLFDESLEVCEDYDLWLRIAHKEKIALLDKKLIYKYAGHDDQLSFKHWGMDRWRVVTLEKLYASINERDKKEQIKKELIQKYRLLYQGAMKYDKIAQSKIYEQKLQHLKV